MIITELYIRGFGKLNDFSFCPKKGFNIILGNNESGKTTIMTFIRACFYGVGGKNDLREKYRPHSGIPMSGFIVFEHNSNVYKLDRTFGATASKDTTELWNISTGEQIIIPAKISVGEYLFGITESTFINTVYIGQASFPTNSKNEEILKRLNNLTSSNDEDISYKEVAERLSVAAKKFKSRSQDSIINKLTSENLDLRKKELKLKEKHSALCSQIEASKASKLQFEEINRQIEENEKLRTASSLGEKKENFSYICELFEKTQNTDDESKALKEKLIYNGKPITHTEIREKSEKLRYSETLDNEIIRLEENLLTIEDRKRDLTAAVNSYSEILENLENIRNLEQLYYNKTTEEKFNNSKKAIGFNAVTIIISLTLLILGIIASQQFGIPAIIAGCIIALIVLIVGCCIKVKPKVKYKQELENQNRQFLSDCKCTTIEELLGKASQIQKDKMQLEAVTLQSGKVIKMINDKKVELSDNDNDIDDFWGEFKGKYSEDLEINELLTAIDRDISLFEETEHKLEYCKNELERAIDGKNIEEVKKELLEAEQLLNRNGDVLPEGSPDFYSSVLAELNSKKDGIAQQIALLSIAEKELLETQKLLEENQSLILENESKLSAANEELLALETAMNVLDLSFEEMQKNFSPIVNKKVGEILSSLTDGKYNDVYISKNLSPTVNAPEDNRLYETKNFSGGTADQIYLALRLAIADTVLNEIELPLMLDDSFSQFDNKRMKRAAEYIYKNSLQVFMFTCHKEDADTVCELGASFTELN